MWTISSLSPPDPFVPRLSFSPHPYTLDYPCELILRTEDTFPNSPTHLFSERVTANRHASFFSHIGRIDLDPSYLRRPRWFKHHPTATLAALPFHSF